ncbi:Probable inactive receptor kinase [Striga hermonthica]|uniref:Probable inactive receptor kinase n=1 Tax=Striga hermonthica TaxID=68872 RepID=A0A9N7NQ04_STRHE|nr:Probable inactive receptor kinase [Striga hermonthica]
MLLELLNRKPSVHVPGGPEAVDLVKMVTSINRIRAANVFDADLLKRPTIKEQMVKTLQIGMKCVQKSMKKRHRMSEVVKMLEEYSLSFPISGALVARKRVFIEDPYPTFDLEDLLRSSAEVLGKGTFGSSYLARLEPGNTIENRAQNVPAVRAYYCSKKMKRSRFMFTVALHGKLGTDKTPLDWETRMKVAVEAARGIAHIHRKDGRKLVHGKIKSSNIRGEASNGCFEETAAIRFFHDHSRSPSILSEASDFSSRASIDDLAFDLARLWSSSTYGRATKLVNRFRFQSSYGLGKCQPGFC